MCLLHVLVHIRGLSSIVGWGRCSLSRLIASISFHNAREIAKKKNVERNYIDGSFG